MTYPQFLAQTADFDDHSSQVPVQPPRIRYPAGSPDSSYAILLVDQDGHTKLFYAPNAMDVTSGHTSGQHTTLWAQLIKKQWRPESMSDICPVWEQSSGTADRWSNWFESFDSKFDWHSLVRKPEPIDFPPFKERGTFVAKATPIEKLELHPELDD